MRDLLIAVEPPARTLGDLLAPALCLDALSELLAQLDDPRRVRALGGRRTLGQQWPGLVAGVAALRVLVVLVGTDARRGAAANDGSSSTTRPPRSSRATGTVTYRVPSPTATANVSSACRRSTITARANVTAVTDSPRDRPPTSGAIDSASSGETNRVRARDCAPGSRGEIVKYARTNAAPNARASSSGQTAGAARATGTAATGSRANT
jgi:hypothetical protein